MKEFYTSIPIDFTEQYNKVVKLCNVIHQFAQNQSNLFQTNILDEQNNFLKDRLPCMVKDIRCINDKFKV